MGRRRIAGAGLQAGTGSGPVPAQQVAKATGRSRVTISDVAARARVSKSAVSFVFNGRRGLSEATTERILRTADDLAGFIDGVGTALAATDTALVVRVVSSAEEESAVYTRFVRESQVDGILIVDLRSSDERPDAPTILGLPVVVAERAAQASVRRDAYSWGRACGLHLVSLLSPQEGPQESPNERPNERSR